MDIHFTDIYLPLTDILKVHTAHPTVSPVLGSIRIAPHEGQKSGSATNSSLKDFSSISENFISVKTGFLGLGLPVIFQFRSTLKLALEYH